MNYKCILFDCDGVLVDSEATSIRVLVDMAADIGLTLDLSEAVQHYSGHALHYCLDHIEAQSAHKFPDNKVQIYKQRTFADFRQNLQAIDGVEAVLQQLECPICVASNAPLDKIELNLNLLNFSHYFKGHLYSAYQLQKWKPDPDLFLHAAQQMGFAPKECAVIEDSLAGVQAAVRGGFDVFTYTKPDYAAAFEALGAIVFFDMADLLPLIVA